MSPGKISKDIFNPTYRCAVVTVELSLRQLSIRRVVDRAEPRGVLNQALVSDDQRLRQLYVGVVRRVLSFYILLATVL